MPSIFERLQIKPRIKRKSHLHTLSMVKLCQHRGILIDRTKCGSEVFACKIHGTCSQQPGKCGNLKLCQNCTDWKPSTSPIRFDHNNLAPTQGGLRFNSSLADHGTHLTLAFRTGWKGSEIYCQKLTYDWQPVGKAIHLPLKRNEANYGREDPRLFWHKNALHIAYIGVTGADYIVNTNMLFARLGPSYEVQDTFAPKYSKRKGNEKNWQFFDYEDQLYAVYTIKPHVILKIDSNAAEQVYRTECPFPWSGGMLRGGASPVRVGDEYFCFFHGKHQHPTTYNIGVYAFEAKPPFRITRMTPHPIYEADRKTNKDNYCPVIFPCGAVQRGDNWLVSCGVHDRWTEIHTFSKRFVEGAMT